MSEKGGHYSESKLRAEEIVRDSGLPFTIVRLPEVYGTGARRESSRAGSRVVNVPRPAVRALCAAAAVVPLPLAPDQLTRLEGPKHEGSAEARDQLGFSPRSLQEGLREHCRPSR